LHEKSVVTPITKHGFDQNPMLKCSSPMVYLRTSSLLLNDR
jgi:hypothetical protein